MRALAAGDINLIEDYICAQPADRQYLIGDGSTIELESLRCSIAEEDVRCSSLMKFGTEIAAVDITFGMVDDKVCEIKETKVNGEVVE